ncbi:MAG: hypothetical protein ACP5N2_00530 [Candidatus Nanoarchaeia archaeon]
MPWTPDPYYLDRIIKDLSKEVDNNKEMFDAPLIKNVSKQNEYYSINQIIQEITLGSDFGKAIYYACVQKIGEPNKDNY